MKKTLVALAAFAATSAFAQSSVTISGNLDFGAINNGKTVTSASDALPAETGVKTDQTSQFNSWTTNQVSIQGTEDMGGGLKASFTINSGLSQAATGASLFGSRDTFVALEGGMGRVQLGRFVTASALGFHGMSGSASTAVGSLYGMSAANTVSTAQVNRFGGAARMTSGDFERGDNKIQFTSTAFNGLTVNANYAKALSDSDAVILTGKTQAVQSGLGLNYVNGPLTLAYGTNTRKVNVEAVAAVDATAAASGVGFTNLSTNAVAESKIDGKLNWLAASYNLGAVTVYAANVSRKDKSTTLAGVETVNFNAKINQFGAKATMGSYTFNGSMYSGKDTRTVVDADNVKLSGYQLSTQYALSKRTSIYALNGTNKIARDGAGAGTAEARKQSVTMVGMLHSF